MRSTGSLTSRHSLAIAVGLVGIVLTAGLSWAARSARDENEVRLTRQRTLEASAVLTAGIPTIEVPLAMAAGFFEGGAPDAALFQRVMASEVGAQRRFVSASVWSLQEGQPVVVVGEDPALTTQPPEVRQRLFDRVRAAAGLSVLDLVDLAAPRLGYALVVPGAPPEYVVYAEQALPPNRMQVVQRDTAFAGLDYAMYLDTAERADSLVLASTDHLPLRGRTADHTTAFGDAQLRLVISPTEDLGGDLLSRLAPLVAVTGGLVTAAGVVLTDRLQRRRREAERLAGQNAELFAEQRAASLTLQKSLLPRRLPDVPGLDIASRYEPGVSGTEVGGDWYDVIQGERRTVLVVGDVSGRGLPAASVMAAVRHTVRALALNGDRPEVILEKVNRPDANDLVGHFVTVLCVELDPESGSMTMASAGHPPPLVVTEDRRWFPSVDVGPPIGSVAGTRYDAATVELPPGAIVALFTDGVFERRGETIEAGLERLRAAAAGAVRPRELVDAVFEDLSVGAGHDDAAILAVRWAT